MASDYRLVLVKLPPDDLALLERAMAWHHTDKLATGLKRLLRSWAPIPLELIKVYLYWKNIKKDRFAAQGQEYLDMLVIEDYLRSQGVDTPASFLDPKQ